MAEKQMRPVKSTVLIWGENDTAIRTAGVISDRQPVLFACPNQVLPSDKYTNINNARLESFEGTNGSFKVVVMIDEKPASFEAGMVIVFPEPDHNVRASLDEAVMADDPETIVITAVGCEPAIFDLVIQKAAAGAGKGHRIYVITDELQVSSRTAEETCQLARDAGVVIFKDAGFRVYDSDSGQVVELTSSSLGSNDTFEIEADRVIAVGPSQMKGDYIEIIRKLGVRQDSSQDRYPFRTSREGVVIVWPLWGEPRTAETIIEILSLAAAIYAGEGIETEVPYWIEPEICALCLTCYRVCPHKAVRFGSKSENLYGQAMNIDPLACMGCGLCWSECPARAVRRTAATSPGRVMVLACENSGGPLLSSGRLPYRLYPCAGSISIKDMLEALNADADRLYVLTCRDGKCQHEYGGQRLSRRVVRLNNVLAGLGIEKRAVVLKVSAKDRAEDIIRKVGERP